MRWVFVGSSPAAPEQVRTILPRLHPCRTITANAGIKLLRPDVYFLADHVACQRYSELAREAKANGTHTVTMHRYRQALEARNVQWFDEFLINGVDPPLPHRWGAYNMSGAICIEYACRNGASEVHILGCEGYSDVQSYFDQSERPTDPKIADSGTNANHIKRFTYVVECFAAIPFHVYGELNYTINLPNWHVHPV
jgi:hypothetical protein